MERQQMTSNQALQHNCIVAEQERQDCREAWKREEQDSREARECEEQSLQHQHAVLEQERQDRREAREGEDRLRDQDWIERKELVSNIKDVLCHLIGAWSCGGLSPSSSHSQPHEEQENVPSR